MCLFSSWPIHPPTSHFPSLSFSLAPVFFSLILRALSQFCSHWRRILWEAAHTHTHKDTQTEWRKEKAEIGMALLVSGSPLRGPVTSTHNLTFRTGVSSYVSVLSWCVFVCVCLDGSMDLGMCARVRSVLSSILSDRVFCWLGLGWLCAGCWSGGRPCVDSEPNLEAERCRDTECEMENSPNLAQILSQHLTLL